MTAFTALALIMAYGCFCAWLMKLKSPLKSTWLTCIVVTFVCFLHGDFRGTAFFMPWWLMAAAFAAFALPTALVISLNKKIKS